MADKLIFVFSALFISSISAQSLQCQTDSTRGGTAGGAGCTLPFIYKGGSFSHCTTVDYENKYWCATSYNYDRDKLWGECICQVVGTNNPTPVYPCWLPKRCSEVLAMDPTSQDGNYTMDFNGQPAVIYCHNMTTGSPREYINLVEKNFFYGLAGGWSSGLIVWYNKTTYYSKVAIDMSTFEIMRSDTTFTAMVYGENQDMQNDQRKSPFHYGKILNCDNCQFPYSYLAFNSIADLRGTGFGFTPSVYWLPRGYLVRKTIDVKSADYTRLEVRCGGCCAGCTLENMTVVALPNQGLPKPPNFCSLKKDDGSQITSPCHSVNMASFQKNQPLFEAYFTCNVSRIRVSFSGVECGAGITYGPYIGGLHLVEIPTTDAQKCHLPFISQTMVNGKCRVTVDYPEETNRNPVIIQFRLQYNENKTIRICQNDVMYSCV